MEHKIRYLALDYSKITSISKGKFTKAKTHKSGFLGMSNTKDGKERATAAVGDEWNQMEKSLLVRKQSETPMKTAVDQTLTKFDDPKNLSSPTAAFAPNTKSAFDFVDDVSAVESRIDVLRELEDIASLAIQETGFFCK